MADTLTLAADQLSLQAYHGQWDAVFDILEQYPALIHHLPEKQGYSVLHQAACYGADLVVMGQLLQYGADTQLKTRDKQQTAYDIALETHPQRQDLRFVLYPAARTLAQLMRKILAQGLPQTMNLADLLLMDNMAMLLCDEECVVPGASAQARFYGAFMALTGTDLSTPFEPPAAVPPHWWVNTDYWRDEFLPELLALEKKKSCIPLEHSWATLGDILTPELEGWGLRGDPWLWMEMRKSLSRVPLPNTLKELTALMRNVVLARTNSSMLDGDAVYIPRFCRGGMSSGHISLRFWEQKGIPAIVQRAEWLREMWGTGERG